MKKLDVKLENCYGIPKLGHTFGFSEHKSHIIYAPNGVMKSSFARVFSKYQDRKEKEIEERIFHKPASHQIHIDDRLIKAEEIFVIKPFEDSFHSENISEILLNEDYKKQYEKIVADLKESKRSFLSRMLSYFQYIQKSGEDLDSVDIKKINFISSQVQVEALFVELFLEREYNSELDFYDVTIKLEENLNVKKEEFDFSNIKYGLIFNDKIAGEKGFLSDSGNRSLLKKYVERYKELINESKYFNLNFTHTNADKIIKQLKDAYYFDTKDKDGKSAVQNGFQLYNKQDDTRDEKEREGLAEEVRLLRQELRKDASFSVHLANIDKALDGTGSTKITKKFREYIIDGDFDLRFFSLLSSGKLSTAKQELIYSYLLDSRDSFDAFVKQTKLAHDEIRALVKKVREDETSVWYKAVEEFNQRFRVPFMVSIADTEKDKALLEGIKLKSLEYKFCQLCGADANRICEHSKESMVEVQESKLVSDYEDSILSQGERRAFYLLNIIFEIKYRKQKGIATLFIIDDIADSFDYQNKYAIAEYLKEISETDNFRSVILTHNFDFFRTLKGRLDENKEGDWFYLAEKSDEEIDLISQKDHFIEPFKDWQLKLEDCNETAGTHIYATILMMRNIVDYSSIYKEQLEFLNNLIHGRGNSFESVTMSEVEVVLKEVGLIKTKFDAELKNKKYLDLLGSVVGLSVKKDSLELEDKIVISLFIRMATERYLRKTLQIGESSKTPLWKMLRDAEAVLEEEKYKKIKRVNLITPEHIHINSFMYEPLIDLDKNQLVSLYNDVLKIVLSGE